jgi:perosamine synthetase
MSVRHLDRTECPVAERRGGPDRSVRSHPVMAYEQAFCRRIGGLRAFAFWKGRVSLYTALKAMGIGAGDEIVLPGYTCLTDALPIKYLGAKPVYVDIEPQTYNMDARQLESRLTPRTRAIIMQHTYGYLADIGAILAIAERHGVPVIEDCCLALGSRYRSRLAGTFGQAAYFSSQWNKTYTTGLGGMLVCHDSTLAERVERICAHDLQRPPLAEVGMLALELIVYRALVYPRTTAALQRIFRWLTSKGLVVGSSGSTEDTDPTCPEGFLRGMSAIQARSGLRQLRRIEVNLEHRRQMARLYDRLLSEHAWSVTPVPAYTDPVLVRYPVRVSDKEGALAAAQRSGIELGDWFVSPLHDQTDRIGIYDYAWGMCPQAERAARETVNLPLHPRTSEATARKTVEFLCRFEQAPAL